MTSHSKDEETPTKAAPASAEPVEEKVEAKAEDEEEEEEDEEEEEEEDEKSEKKEKKDKPKKVEIEYEATMPREEAVSYFEALIAGLRSGHLEFRQGDRTLVLNPPGHVEIEVSAEQKGDKGKVVFEIEWSNENQPLTIISDAPKSDAPATESDD